MSEQHFDDIEKLFHDSIERHREQPSPSTWDAIEQKLDEDDERRRPLFWLFERKSILLLILLIGTAVIVTINYTSDKEKNSSHTHISTPSKEKANQEVTRYAPPGAGTSQEGASSIDTEKAGSQKKSEDVVVNKDAIEINTTPSTITEETKGKNQAVDLPTAKRFSKNHGKVTPVIQRNNNEKSNLYLNTAKKSQNNPKYKNAPGFSGTTNNTNTSKENKLKEPRDVVNLSATTDKIKLQEQHNVPIAVEDNKLESIITKTQSGDDSINKKSVVDTSAILTKATLADTPDKIVTIKKNKSAFKPFFTVSAVYAPNVIKNKYEQGVYQYKEDNKEEIKQKETIKQSFAYGLLVEYSFKKNWAIQTGLKFTSTTTSIETKNVYARPDVFSLISLLNYKYNCTYGSTYIPAITGIPLSLGDSAKAAPSESKVNYAIIPFTLQYAPSFGRVFLVGTAGANVNFLTRSTIDTEISFLGFRFPITSEIQGLKKTYISGHYGLGIGYKASDRLSLFISPTRTFSFGAVNENTPVRTYERNLSYQALVRYSFMK